MRCEIVGDFHFDSEARVTSRTSAYSFDRQLGRSSGNSVSSTLFLPYDLILETSPNRELVEEFAETLSVD